MVIFVQRSQEFNPFNIASPQLRVINALLEPILRKGFSECRFYDKVIQSKRMLGNRMPQERIQEPVQPNRFSDLRCEQGTEHEINNKSVGPDTPVYFPVTRVMAMNRGEHWN